MTDTATQSASTNPLSTGGLATADNKQFVLSDAAWYKVQLYIEQGLRLPTTIESIKEWLANCDNITDDITADLQSLSTTYTGIVSHCKDWKSVIYPRTVDVASHIVEYNQEVPDLYDALKETLTELQAAITDNDAQAMAAGKKDFQDLLSDRISTAQQYQGEADKVAAAISDFVTTTQSDQTSLKTLKGDFDSKYGDQGSDVATVTAELASAQANLKSAQDDMAKDLILIETAPSYAWVPFVGMIAAGVVIGVYVDRMADAARKIAVERAMIAAFSAEIARDQSLMYTVDFGSNSIDNVLTHLNDALPVIEQIRDAWKSIADGLDALYQLLESDTAKAAQDIKASDIDTAINDWSALAAKANTFRANAYITVTDTAS